MPVPPIQEVLDLLQQKDVEAAIDLLEQTVEEVPAHLPAHMILARAYEARGQWNRALRSWDRAHFLLPNSPVVQEGQQRVRQHLEEPEPATQRNGSPLTSPDESEATDSSVPDEESVPEDAPTPVGIDESEGPSSLEELRQQTEEASQQGGARSGLDSEETVVDSSTTPEEHVEQLQDAAPDSDLDHLIEELESARIEPRPDPENAPEPDLEDDVDDLVSETLARIHGAQGQYLEAARIYRRLATQEPERSQEYLERASEMRAKAEAGDEPE